MAFREKEKHLAADGNCSNEFKVKETIPMVNVISHAY